MATGTIIAMDASIATVSAGSTPAGPYSPGIIAEGRFVYVSGQLPQPVDGELPDTIEDQTELVLAQVARVLDAAVQANIEKLEAERAALRRRESYGGQDLEADVTQLEEIRVELDRLWDLKRQRAASAAAGHDPTKARERSADTVEHYRQ